MGNLLIHVRKVYWIHYTVYYCGFDDTLNIEKQFLSSTSTVNDKQLQGNFLLGENQSCKSGF